MIPGNFKYLFLDADDTLWHNEGYFREAERRFCARLSAFASPSECAGILMRRQEENIPLYGYGSKTYLLGMLDSACDICGKDFNSDIYWDIKQIIKDLAFHEFELIDGVEPVLKALLEHFVLAVVTKGDLTEQRYKYFESGLGKYFHHIEVLPNKDESDYREMARKMDILPEQLLMVGNSVKSDIAPVVAIGGTAIHIPYAVTWAHEHMEMPQSDRIYVLDSISQLPDLLL